jgi:hypothetical protein
MKPLWIPRSNLGEVTSIVIPSNSLSFRHTETPGTSSSSPNNQQHSQVSPQSQQQHNVAKLFKVLAHCSNTSFQDRSEEKILTKQPNILSLSSVPPVAAAALVGSTSIHSNQPLHLHYLNPSHVANRVVAIVTNETYLLLRRRVLSITAWLRRTVALLLLRRVAHLALEFKFDR